MNAFAKAMTLFNGQNSVEKTRKYLASRKYGECKTYTPDINALEKHQRQLIFIMDDMLPGGIYHDYITETNLFGRWPACVGYTEDEFTFWNRNLGKDSYPVALSPDLADKDKPGWVEDRGHKPGRIFGNVYSIRPYQFKKLDFLRENGIQFTRKRVKIRIPHQKSFHKPIPEVSYELGYFLECWMYIGNSDYWNDLIDNGFDFSPVKQIKYQGIRSRPWLDRYYVYQNGTYK